MTLQLLGINLAGALVRVFEISSEGPYFEWDNRWLFPLSLAVSVLVVGTLFAVHLGSAPVLVHSSLAQRVAYQMRQAVGADDVARIVQTSAGLTRADAPDADILSQETLLGAIYAQRDEGAIGDNETLGPQREAQHLGHADFTPPAKVELLDALA